MFLPAERQSGFTLVEMLVSLVVLSMTAAMVAAGLGGAHRLWQRDSSRQQAAESVESAQTSLRTRIERAVPATRYDGRAPYADFLGTSDAFRFLSPPAEAYGVGALRRNTLRLAVDGTLMLSSTNDLWRNAPSAVREEVLMRGVQSVDIAYFGAFPSNGALQWQNTWQHRAKPPLLVRIRVRFPPGDSRWWPDLIVKLWSTIDLDCAQDVATGRCRGR